MKGEKRSPSACKDSNLPASVQQHGAFSAASGRRGVAVMAGFTSFLYAMDACFGIFCVTLQKPSCTREIESKLSFRSFALPLQKPSCTREIESKLSFRSFALPLQNASCGREGEGRLPHHGAAEGGKDVRRAQPRGKVVHRYALWQPGGHGPRPHDRRGHNGRAGARGPREHSVAAAGVPAVPPQRHEARGPRRRGPHGRRVDCLQRRGRRALTA